MYQDCHSHVDFCVSSTHKQSCNLCHIHYTVGFQNLSAETHVLLLKEESNNKHSDCWVDEFIQTSGILVLKLVLVFVFIQFWINNFYFSFSFSFKIILVSISVLVSVLK